MTAFLVSDPNTVPGTSQRLPISFPPRNLRIRILTLRGIILVLFVAGTIAMSFAPSTPDAGTDRFGLASGSLEELWLFAGLFWIATCALVAFDGRRLSADRDGITTRSAFRTRFVPWTAISGVSSTGTGIRIAREGGGGAESVELVSRRWQARLAVRVSPMEALAARLEAVRRALRAGASANLGLEARTRLFDFTVAEWAQIGGMFVLLAIGPLVRTFA